MKKLNKKGFTLVELLAVVVILAILIAVVAGTALPAMNNAKKSVVETYAKRVVEQAKTLYTSAEIGTVVDGCGVEPYSSQLQCTFTDIKKIMGEDVDKYKLDGSLTVTKSTTGYNISGKVKGEGYTTNIETKSGKIVFTTS